MTTTVEKPALRQSSLLMFLRCQEQYNKRYVEGIKSPPRSALAFGSAFHNTTDANYSQKIETHEDIPTPDLQDIFRDSFNKRTEEVEWSEKEKGEKVEIVKGKMLDNGVACVAEYQDIIAPKVQPVAVEHEFKVQFDDDYPYDLGGIIDMIANIEDGPDDEEQAEIFRPEGEVIVDHKTAGKSPAASVAHQSLQLTLYALGYRATTGKIERGMRLDHIVKTKAPKIVKRPTTRTQHQIDAALKLIGRAVLNIEHARRTGAFLPTEPSNWWCSSDWCGYWNICEFGGKK